jgi:hypothetical protein
MSGGYVALEPGDSQSAIQSALNAMNTEQYGAMALTTVTVANIAALDALPSYYLVTGKIANVVDSDGLGTPNVYSWSGSAWVAVPYVKTVGALVHSATSITPTGDVFHVDGTTTIQTITGGVNGQQIVLIPDAVWHTGTSGNVAVASTAVVGVALTLTYIGADSKWYPSA